MKKEYRGLDGDTVVVEKRGAAVGDIVVAIVDNAFTLKILAREKGRFVLRPANKAYAVIRPRGDLEIFGVVTGLFRKTASASQDRNPIRRFGRALRPSSSAINRLIASNTAANCSS